MISKENARDYIPLLEALADGELQTKVSGEIWHTITSSSIALDAPISSYRRKPKSREFWIYGVLSFLTKQAAIEHKNACQVSSDYKIIHVREVI